MEILNKGPQWDALFKVVYPTPSIAPKIAIPTVIPAVKAAPNDNNMIIGVCLVLLIIGGVAIYYHVQSQKKEEKIPDQ